jgi:hypothetical protein
MLGREVGSAIKKRENGAINFRDHAHWLWDVANEMDQEDGLIQVYGPGDDGVMAFTDFGIETLTGLIEIYKANPDLLKRSSDPE